MTCDGYVAYHVEMLTTEALRAALTGVNLSRLAAHCGLNRKTLQRIRDGENSPTLQNAEAIAAALKEMKSGKSKRQLA